MKYHTSPTRLCLLFGILAIGWPQLNSLAAEAPARFIGRLEKGEKVTIVTLGTSLTGGEWRWVDVMKEWLDAEWPGQVKLHNLGVGASASQTVPAMKGNRWTWKRCGVDRLREAITLKPDTVFIEFAVNDAFLPYGISLEQSRSNLVAMIDAFLAADPNTEILLQTMNAVTDTCHGKHASQRPRVADYYQMYRDVAGERGLLLVDHYPNWLQILQENRERFLKLVPDGVHPQLPGYREVLLPELKRCLRGGIKHGAAAADDAPVHVQAHFELANDAARATGKPGAEELINRAGDRELVLGRIGSPRYSTSAPKSGPAHGLESLSFDGKSQYRMAKAVTPGAENFRLEAYAKAKQASHRGLHAVVANGNGANGYMIAQHDDRWVVFVGRWGEVTFGPVVEGQWEHLAAVRHNGELRLYRNGKLIASSFAATPAISANFSIGGVDGHTRECFLGEIASVSFSLLLKIYEEVYIKDEVLADYHFADDKGQKAKSRGALPRDLVMTGQGVVTASNSSPYGNGSSLSIPAEVSYRTETMITPSLNSVIYEAYVCADEAKIEGYRDILVTGGRAHPQYLRGKHVHIGLGQEGENWVAHSHLLFATKKILAKVESGKWTHLAVVLERHSLSCYVDGIFCGIMRGPSYDIPVQEQGRFFAVNGGPRKLARVRVSTAKVGTFNPSQHFFLNDAHKRAAAAAWPAAIVARKEMNVTYSWPYVPPPVADEEEFAARKKRVEWFRRAKYGLFVHFLAQDYKLWKKHHRWTPESWDEHVEKVDVEAFAEQCQQVGAGYVVLSLGQNFPYFCAPNPIIDRMMGYKPAGVYSSERDLPMDLHQALEQRGIRLMLYITGHPFDGNGFNKGPRRDEAGFEAWCEAASWYSKHYGRRCQGWWVDGLSNLYPGHAERFHAALRSGNPDTIIASHFQGLSDFDHGHCGENWTLQRYAVPYNGRWTIDQNQFHVLLHLGRRWGAVDTPKPTETLVDYTRNVVDGGGVITFEIGSYRQLPNGQVDAPCLEIPAGQVKQLLEVKRAMETVDR